MTKDEIIRKLTSRKFWAAIAGFVTGLLIYFGKTAEQADQVAALIMSAASVVAYIVGEGLIDAAGAGREETVGRLPGKDQPPDDSLEDDGK
jgi:hypothetical protein